MFRTSDFHFVKKKKKNRDTLELIKDMLYVATEKSNKTRILYDAHLNYRILEKYLKILMKNGLIKQVENNSYLTTNKGHFFLQKFEDYCELCKKLEQDLEAVRRERLFLTDMYQKLKVEFR